MEHLLNLQLPELRRRRSAKWTTYPNTVLPLPVAEMDVRLAPPIAEVLHTAIARSDTGYAGETGGLRAAFSSFAQARWRWDTGHATFRTCADVATGATELLRLLASGADVVLTPPVYPPFYSWIAEARARPLEVPLIEVDGSFALDLAGIERAFQSGARAMLLCHPHNPTGHVVPPQQLGQLADLAIEHGVIVLSDEILAPLVMPGIEFQPYLSVSENAARSGIALHSASKAWNIAGLKCALIVAADASLMPADLPHELSWGVGNLGIIAAETAYREGTPWLDQLLASLQSNARLLGGLLAQSLPGVRFEPPRAGYVAWLDLGEVVRAPSPAEFLLDVAGVALNEGTDFGPGGTGRVRLNFACSPAVLIEAVSRMERAAAGSGAGHPAAPTRRVRHSVPEPPRGG